MVRPLSFAFLVVAIAAGGTTVAQQPPKTVKPRAGGEIVDGEVGKALDDAMLEVDKADGGFCGVVLVGSKGSVLLAKGYGVADAASKKPMPADALFDWASVSMQFTAAAMLRLIDVSNLDDADLKKLGSKKLGESIKKWKKLGLDDPLSRFFPDAPADKAAVTLRQILNHTSGIEAGFKEGWQFDHSKRDAFVDFVLKLPMTSKPGEKFDESNSGYAFAAAIVEKLSGMTFEEFCDEQLFKPAGMKSATMVGRPGVELARVPKASRGAGFADHPKDAFAFGNQLTWGSRGCGGVVATTQDLFAWDRALRGDKILSTAALDDFYKPGRVNERGTPYALGWEIVRSGGTTRVQHTGAAPGLATFLMRHLDHDQVVALACTYEPKTPLAQIATRLAKIVDDAK